MNVVDVAILLILAIFLVKGVVRGLLKELCLLVGLLGGAVLAFSYHASLADLLVESLRFPPIIAVATAFLALFLTTILFFTVLGHLLSKFVNLLFLGGLNRLAGAFFGLTQGVVLLAVVLFALSLRPLPGFLQPMFKRSELAPPFIHLGEATYRGSCRVLPLCRTDAPRSAMTAR
ncbi:MAG TPA: CvpA family protein [Desulfuromonadales bacterium]|nr:CvpA family protein [Desulfuromonadales bacterium]